jgi:hypothetical protein
LEAAWIVGIEAINNLTPCSNAFTIPITKGLHINHLQLRRVQYGAYCVEDVGLTRSYEAINQLLPIILGPHRLTLGTWSSDVHSSLSQSFAVRAIPLRPYWRAVSTWNLNYGMLLRCPGFGSVMYPNLNRRLNKPINYGCNTILRKRLKIVRFSIPIDEIATLLFKTYKYIPTTMIRQRDDFFGQLRTLILRA